MLWVNHQWLRGLDDDALARGALPFFERAGLPAAHDQKLRHVVRMARERAKTFAEIAQQFRYFYAPIALDPKARAKFLVPESRPLLQAIRDGLAALEAPDAGQLEQLFQKVAESRALGIGKVAQPVRVALTGGTASPGIYDVVLILGKAESLQRLDDALRLVA
jgi:glutamyl-tRNA synthetase